MWPYGYTLTNVPSRHDDATTTRRCRHRPGMARPTATRPSRRATCTSAREPVATTIRSYRIFTFTFELSITDYPDDSMIASETGRNREAALYLAERAWCPVASAAVRIARCGAFDDDLEVYRGWALNPDGTDTAPIGAASPRRPSSTSSNGPKQLGSTPSGTKGYVTGSPAGSSSTANDLDGRTSVLRGRPVRPSPASETSNASRGIDRPAPMAITNASLRVQMVRNPRDRVEAGAARRRSISSRENDPLAKSSASSIGLIRSISTPTMR